AERLSHARSLTNLPLVAIGGINISNVEPVIHAGADSICVTAAVGLAEDPEKASHDLVQAIANAGGKI
ncbi:MAG: thiamine phosphate synthase, partial [Dehalococcoidia bacterium]|nr:thiamine phosphate synthase [Dehalococcoidia bacterium]